MKLEESCEQATDSACVWRMGRLTRDGTTEPVSRDYILRGVGIQGNIHLLPCSADHEQDWQRYPVDPYSALCDDHAYLRTFISIVGVGKERRTLIGP